MQRNLECGKRNIFYDARRLKYTDKIYSISVFLFMKI